jgi:hypothetical protein
MMIATRAFSYSQRLRLHYLWRRLPNTPTGIHILPQRSMTDATKWIDDTSSPSNQVTVTTKLGNKEQHHLSFQSMAEGMQDLNCCDDINSANVMITEESNYPIRREAALQVDKMQRTMTFNLQEATLQHPPNEDSGDADYHLPFCAATVDDTPVTDLVSFGPIPPISSSEAADAGTSARTPTGTHAIRQALHTTVSAHSHMVADTSHHQTYQALSDGPLFDLESYDCNPDAVLDALEHGTERMAALEHDRMERKEHAIIQNSAWKQS